MSDSYPRLQLMADDMRRENREKAEALAREVMEPVLAMAARRLTQSVEELTASKVKPQARIEKLEQALLAIQRAHDANSSDSAALAQIHRIVCAALAQTGEPTG